MRKVILKGSGFVALGLGLAGIVVPLLPTTPFLLLSLWCFTHSSSRLQSWLLDHPLLGPYLRNYRSGLGVPRGVKIWTLTLMWATMLGTCVWLEYAVLWVVLPIIGAGVTFHIVKLKTRRNEIQG